MATTTLQPRQISVITLCLSIFYMFATTLLATLFSLRALSGDSALAWPLFKVLSCLSILAAYFFVFAEAILNLGLHSDKSFLQVCTIGTYVAIGMYTVFKLAFYVFLVERVHLVYGYKRNVPVRRLEAIWYRFSLTVVAAWTCISVSMLIARVVKAKASEEICVRSIKSYASIVMLIINTGVCTVLTAAFAIPIFRSRFNKSQRLALTSCIATALGTLASVANLLWMMHAEGPQRAWSRGLSSSLDVVFNAVLAFAITTTPDRKACQTKRKQVEFAVSKTGRPDTCLSSSACSIDGIMMTRQTSKVRDDEELEEEDINESEKLPVVGWLDRLFNEHAPVEAKNNFGSGTKSDSSLAAGKESKSTTYRPKTAPDRMSTRNGEVRLGLA
ncbi:BQ2448_4274 [Microbotryum intermedium]|uniref:BQ2448_4274 protein n=1 Tax=Microbotryum intermedium TaxID=269621 RepID=A0A238FHM0_9BASI|nr:BQ2448_4274 [Microbotryum intermedium]